MVLLVIQSLVRAWPNAKVSQQQAHQHITLINLQEYTFALQFARSFLLFLATIALIPAFLSALSLFTVTRQATDPVFQLVPYSAA